MSNLVLLSENPSFIAFATGVLLLLLFIGFVGFHLLTKVTRLETDIKKIRFDGANALDRLSNLSISWNECNKNFEKVESRHNQIIAMVEQIRFEQELLTKTVGSDNKLSKAIEFARSGFSVDDIVKKAGISVDEAKAVVRFHGPNDPD